MRNKYDSNRFLLDNELIDFVVAEIGSKAAILYVALVRFANYDTQECWPSHKTLMERSGIGNKRTLINKLKLLEKKQLVEVIKRGGGKSNSNQYRILNVEGWKLNGVDTATLCEKKGDISDDKQWQNYYARNGITDTGNKRNKKTYQPDEFAHLYHE